MKKHLLLVIFLSLTTTSIFSQKIEPEVLETTSPIEVSPKIILKFSPISLLSLMPAFQFSVEHQLKEKMYLQHEVGYMSGVFWESLGDYDHLNGYRLHHELRFYNKPVGSKELNFFGGPALFFQHRIGSGNEWFCIEDCAYRQRFNFREHRFNFGTYGFLGWQHFSSDVFMVEYGMGLGADAFYKTNAGVPDGVNRAFDNGLFGLETNHWYLLPKGLLILKIGFRVK